MSTIREDAGPEGASGNQPVVMHVISDSLGQTAMGVVEATTVQFERGRVAISLLTNVSDAGQVRAYFDRYAQPGVQTAVFYTILDEDLRSEVLSEVSSRGMVPNDLLSPYISVVSQLLGENPLNIPGLVIRREKLRDGDGGGMVVRTVDASTL